MSTDETRSPPQPGPLLSDIAVLRSFIEQDEQEGADPDIAELLRHLETAEGIAAGVESQVDEIIGNLDEILGTLEAHEQATISNRESTIIRRGDTVVQEEQATVVVTESVEVQDGSNEQKAD
ncbi:uncharacterized protein LAESUDRAFT_723765 [Laetiporus sulphureus 93-53]|uniref:Uncharacterized protein n=1 Tax=Laetiporus sulphureus 93-53 TaxID=1314785 RepID=A0A165FDR9_9APHY|nr:uncharacterized protein LAESUDRAFT_723765 [Laetiporus sulphureus 93-53]KZT08816.1 hypothetical protein LAESUDRAFT_723765 [Laetiporus sulphureus 93-53]